jgi:hypothetical protein
MAMEEATVSRAGLGPCSARLTLEVGQESGPYLALLQLVDLNVPVSASFVSLCFPMFAYARLNIRRFYSGHVAGGDPSHGLCLASAMFDLGSIPMSVIFVSSLLSSPDG